LQITENQFFPLEPIEALKAGFKKAESEFLKLAESKSIVDRSGSCALVVLIIDNMCYIANVGDSRAVLSYQFGSKVFPLSHDHKPDRTSEKDRILGAGGKIYQSVLKNKAGTSIPGPYRLLPGKLSVSRSFGDIEAKL
jgi:protein phosphatase 2C family protein 2/3